MDRPFPYGLLVALAVIGWGTWSLDDGWARYGGLAAVVVLAVALAVQVQQRDKARADARRRAAEPEAPDRWDDGEEHDR